MNIGSTWRFWAGEVAEKSLQGILKQSIQNYETYIISNGNIKVSLKNVLKIWRRELKRLI